ncbi:endocytosis ankyrin repeat protein [Fusarium napiforme]|uniref:Endocytosis ankyrin repeat protein n=1 Tax=Fusarium napiforme TaxID=42672 RepID=A0A8H5J497_9HYPO|nr:endocytosis ankyrin repeat protein [Fusarium napiforme]
MQAREQTDPTMPAQRLIGAKEHPLVSLTIQELEEILEELNEIVEKYSRSRKVHDPKRYTDKVKWLSDAGKIEELRERAQATKSNLHMAITFRLSSMVDRGNVRQEVEVGYELKSCWTFGGKPEVDKVIDKALSFVQGWDEVSTTKVHKAAAAGGGVLDALREQPWAIDELDEYGRAPIHFAVLSDNFEGLEQLMAAKADLNRQDPAGCTPLMRASYENDAMLQKLLEHSECQKRISQGNVQGMTALHFAVSSGPLACTRLLLEAGAPVSKTDENGRAPIHYLGWGNQEHQQEIDDIIKLLQDYGADIESKDNLGRTPILWACREGNVPVLGALVRAGASLGAIDSNGNGILHITALSNDFDVVHYLAEQDLEEIDTQLRNLSQDVTPLGSLWWVFYEYFPHSTTVPTQEQQQTFITFYFKLLILDLERHMLTLRNIQEAIQDRDSEATTELLDILIRRNEAGFRQELVGWYRALKFYVSDGHWNKLKEAICEEYDEISEKTERAAIARGKTLTDPEMEEFS